MSKGRMLVAVVAVVALAAAMCGPVFGNGGPFVVKYPSGDPAAKGILARLDPDLKPGTEARLRVLKEDLSVTFVRNNLGRANEGTPLVRVVAAYTIENPTDADVNVDFGFPILRGIYIPIPGGMSPARPEATVTVGENRVQPTIISNSFIYGIIRQRSREVIDKGIAGDVTLAWRVKAVRASVPARLDAARKVFADHLTGELKWNEREAALLVEYVSLDFGQLKAWPLEARGYSFGGTEQRELMQSNLGPLGAIGEQKATQFFAQLATRFDPKAGASYESIFAAWGGDVREQALDLKTAKLRPREISVDKEKVREAGYIDPTIYARVDYLDPDAKITDAEKQSCKAILKNLDVIFTFAPMNLLHYQAKFAAKSKQVLTVSYAQYAFADTGAPASYQIAYVVHPASFWKEFGPINLSVAVPDGVDVRASVACKKENGAYRAVLEQKTGEIYIAVDSQQWKAATTLTKGAAPARPAEPAQGAAPVQQVQQRTKK